MANEQSGGVSLSIAVEGFAGRRRLLFGLLPPAWNDIGMQILCIPTEKAGFQGTHSLHRVHLLQLKLNLSRKKKVELSETNWRKKSFCA